jgi:flavodoxin
MRKVFKIILAILAVFIIIIVAFGAVFFLDLSAYMAAGTKTLTPTGTSTGNALVVYDPGLSGAAAKAAEKIAVELQEKAYTVMFAGIKSAEAADTAGYSIIVVGGPIYAGGPTSSVKDFLGSLNPNAATAVGVFGSGEGVTTPEDVSMIRNAVPALQSGGSLQDAVVVKIGQTEDLDARASELVNQLAG